MEAAWPSYLHSFSSDLSALCQQYLADTPLEPLLTSKYVSWASVIGLLLGGVAYSVSPGVLLQTPRSQTQETEVGPPPIAKTSTTARLCFNTQPAQMLDELKTCPAGGGINQQDANGWTALMWSAHWGEDEHVFALLDAGADDAIVTKRPWYNLAVEYSEGMSALSIAKFDAEEYDDSPTMLRIVEMLESAALGEWGEQQEDFRRRVGTDEGATSESADDD